MSSTIDWVCKEQAFCTVHDDSLEENPVPGLCSWVCVCVYVCMWVCERERETEREREALMVIMSLCAYWRMLCLSVQRKRECERGREERGGRGREIESVWQCMFAGSVFHIRVMLTLTRPLFCAKRIPIGYRWHHTVSCYWLPCSQEVL